MPSDAQLFGEDSGEGMFKNLNFDDSRKSMFRTLSAGYPDDPSPAEMEKAKMEAVRYDRKVHFLGAKVYTFDLSKAEDVDRYVDLRNELYDKVRKQEYVVQHFERKYTEVDGRPRWLVHIEVHEYEYTKIDNAKTYVSGSGDTPYKKIETEIRDPESGEIIGGMLVTETATDNNSNDKAVEYGSENDIL